MPPKTSKKRSASAAAEAEPRRKSARLNVDQTSIRPDPAISNPQPANNAQNHIQVVVDGDKIADIINKMARRCIRGIERDDNDSEVVITTFQERALDALENLYTRTDACAVWAKTRNRGSSIDYGSPEEELLDAEEQEERRKNRGPHMIDVQTNLSFDEIEGEVLGPEGDLYCYCQRAEFGRMYLCENDECATAWFHEGCIVRLMKKDHQPVEDEDWRCPACAEAEKQRRRERVTQGLWQRPYY